MTWSQKTTDNTVDSAGKDRPAEGAPSAARWNDIVERVRIGDATGMEELYAVFSKGVRFFLCRQLGPNDLDDRVHDAFLVVMQAIQRGELREPERLMGYVRTVVKRQIAACIEKNVQARREMLDQDSLGRVYDHRRTPEEDVIIAEKTELMREVLDGISDRDREILVRFYLQEQSQAQICSDMNLTETQFRLLKSRAKARFGELGRKKLSGNRMTIFLRGFARSNH
jgi:RNA polymerase sigma-70 factor (ECF subfamily)